MMKTKWDKAFKLLRTKPHKATAAALFLVMGGLISSASGESNKNLLLQQAANRHIFVNNRIVAKVNGNPISIIDIMKKLDLIFYREFPQYASSVEARHQFYTMNWKPVLNELIEQELIMADAEEVKMEVSHGDIRQEMENLFGPNIIVNLDKAGLTYQEAWKMVKEDLMLKRMMSARVNSKVIRTVTPADVRAYYEEYAKTHQVPDAWSYRILSIKGKNPAACKEAASFVHHLITADKTPLNALNEKFKNSALFSEELELSVSDENTRTEKEISEDYRKILSSLKPDSYSAPISQKSRLKQSQVIRIFYLKDFAPGGAPPFSDVEKKLKGIIIEKRINEESGKYIDKLKAHFDIQGTEEDPAYSKEFQPFVLS